MVEGNHVFPVIKLATINFEASEAIVITRKTFHLTLLAVEEPGSVFMYSP